MFRLCLAGSLALLSYPAQAQEYAAVTIASTAVMAAPSSISEQVGTLPAGTRLNVLICFSEAEYCAVETGDISGFVASDLLSTTPDERNLVAGKARPED